jgi:large subunit ribosomal protein L28
VDNHRKQKNGDKKYGVNTLHITLYMLAYRYYKNMKCCPITKKGSMMGGGYSNRVRATKFNPTGKKRKYPNLQTKTIFVPEIKKAIRLTLSTKAIRLINKKGAYPVLKDAGII